MRLTNERGIPDPIFLSEQKDAESYKRRSHISVTELSLPARLLALRRIYEEQLIEDMADRIAAWEGKAIHYYLEHHTDGIRELYLRMKCLGWDVSGRADRYVQRDGRWIVQDYKYVKPYTTRGGVKPEWVEQLNFLAVLLRANRLPVDKLEVVTIYKAWDADCLDWKEYPQTPSEILPVIVLNPVDAESLLQNRVLLHKKTQESTGQLAYCTPEDRWFGWDKKLKTEVSKRCNRFCNVARQCRARNDGQEY